MKKHLLAVGIIFLFFISALTPMSLGFDIKDLDLKELKPISSGYGNPPKEEWEKTFGGLNHDNGRNVCQTLDDGYAITGCTYTFDTGGNGDLWIIKTNQDGNEEWNESFGGNALDVGNSIKQTFDGGYIVTGWTKSFGLGHYDVWLVKTDSTGNEEWNNTYGGNQCDMGQSVLQTDDGGYLIVGNTRSYGLVNYDVWLVKTDSYGNQEWNTTYGGENDDRAYFLTSTNNGSYVIVGYTWVDDNSNTDVWLIKIDVNGNMLWNRTIGGPHFEIGHMIRQTNDGGFIIVGKFTSNESSALLIKTDTYGFKEWSKTYGLHNSGRAVCQAIDKGFIFLMNSFIDSYHGKFSVIRTDCFGTELWNITYGTGEELHYCRHIEMSNDGGYIICGDYDVYGTNLSDAWLIKLAKDNHPPSNPIINGPTHGKVGVEYTYTFNSTHPSGYNITYYVSWGDGSPNESHGPVPPGVEVEATHTWNNIGTYFIRAKAREYDEHTESGWGELQVTIPRDKSTDNMFLLRIFERFPSLQRLLDVWGSFVE
jgi:hypothetical protein